MDNGAAFQYRFYCISEQADFRILLLEPLYLLLIIYCVLYLGKGLMIFKVLVHKRHI